MSSTCVDEGVKSEENEQTGPDDRKGRGTQITSWRCMWKREQETHQCHSAVSPDQEPSPSPGEYWVTICIFMLHF